MATCGAGAKETAAYDLSVRTYDEAAQVAALLKAGAGGGGLASKRQAPTFNNGQPAARNLTIADVPLGNKPIKRAAMTHLWCAHAISATFTRGVRHILQCDKNVPSGLAAVGVTRACARPVQTISVFRY